MQPVKIAILDTGAHISPEQIDLYDDRIIQCRSWLNTENSRGELLQDPSSDHDGHGTHGTSILLDATQGTDIKIYVAQIFESRSEKLKDDSFVDNATAMRIANVSQGFYWQKIKAY